MSVDTLVGHMPDVSVILLNGPPRSGKDTGGNYIASVVPRAKVMKFAEPLKRGVHVDFGLPYHIWPDYFEDCKDEPNPAFFGLTPRQAYIEKSERGLKPLYGPDIYGRVFLRKLWEAYQQGVRTAVVTDSGFALEAMPVVEYLTPRRVLLLRVHAEDRQCSFKGDSRSYIDLPSVTTLDVQNNRDLNLYYVDLLNKVTPFLNRCHLDTLQNVGFQAELQIENLRRFDGSDL